MCPWLLFLEAYQLLLCQVAPAVACLLLYCHQHALQVCSQPVSPAVYLHCAPRPRIPMVCQASAHSTAECQARPQLWNPAAKSVVCQAELTHPLAFQVLPMRVLLAVPLGQAS